METITFYSYKGGVGRTLALVNTAIYLSRFGLNTCLLDFDLEAPGLHYKLTQYLKTDEIKDGLVDYIFEFTENKVIPESLIPFSNEIIPKTNSQGEIRLIPAGNVLTAEYWKKLASINWFDLFYKKDSEGVPFFFELKERIDKEFNPDFLLIDSRTGITEMSGVCTVLLPDKIVFLIVNNQENIEGARQIFRSIQKAERLPEQKPIEFVFALTRIPFHEIGEVSSDEASENERKENQIVTNVLNILNKGIDEPKDRLNVKDICIIHSDRELELSESLRFGKYKPDIDTSITNDYLRLFTKVLTDDVMSSKIDSVLDNLLSIANILDDPDRVQMELEKLSLDFSHPMVLEKLVEFYILRKAGSEKILDTFDKLWKIFGINNSKILSKYVTFFMIWNFKSPRRPNFDIVREYINLNPSNRISIETKLVRAYRIYIKDFKELLQCYNDLIDKAKYKTNILGIVIDDILSCESESAEDAMNLLEKYSDIVSSDVDLRIKKIRVIYLLKRHDELLKLLGDEWVSARDFLDREPDLYLSVMTDFGKEDIVNDILNIDLEKALIEENYDELFRVGSIYYKLNKEDEFKDKIAKSDKSDSSLVQKVIEDLKKDDDIPF